MNTLAQKINIGGQEIVGPMGVSGIATIGDLVNVVTGFLMPIVGLILFIVLVSGGYDFMMSQGDPNKIKTAQAKITSGLIGFGILISAFFITKLISYIFGLGQGIL